MLPKFALKPMRPPVGEYKKYDDIFLHLRTNKRGFQTNFYKFPEKCGSGFSREKSDGEKALYFLNIFNICTQ